MKKNPVKSTTAYREAMREARRAKTKTFRTGGSTAVRIPKEFQLEESEVMITRVAEGILISPATAPLTVAGWWDSWEAMPDFMADGRQQPAMQNRDLAW
jgi:antitoxin VapB